MAGSETPQPSPQGGVASPRRRAGLYLRVFLLAALAIVLVALAVANTPTTVELSWVFGSGHVALVWVIVFAVIVGWLAGIVTGAIIRHRSRG